MKTPANADNRDSGEPLGVAIMPCGGIMGIPGIPGAIIGASPMVGAIIILS